MEKKSHLVLIISIVTGILLAMLVGILVYFNLPAQRIRRMLKSANKYIAEENYDEAILTLQKILEIDPKNEDLYVLLADTYEKNGDIDKEIEFLQEAVTLMPENQKIADVLSDVNSEVTISEAEGTYTDPIRLTLDATEDSKIYYIISGDGANDTNSADDLGTDSKEKEYSEPITLGKSGKYSIEYYAISKTGYEGEHKTATYVLKLDESKYHFNEWVDEADGRHFYDADGKSITGWKEIGALWYLFDKSGVMLTGFQEYEENTYYLGTDGIMRTGWQEINGKKCYFNDSGAMLRNQWIDGTYYVGEDGAMLTNTYTPDGYYVGADGKYISESASGSMTGQTVYYKPVSETNWYEPVELDNTRIISIHYLSETTFELTWNINDTNELRTWTFYKRPEYGENEWSTGAEFYVTFEGDSIRVVLGGDDFCEYYCVKV
ncbi:tetratricopeptide repeat protein [Oribacterium sp. FC2011]|uniref:tetratricopeptide repeat protein n=1 Tax=Oribacterium sp. FC2011 TaxID=1408311 RepID=UPI000679C8EE|nr:tetratricopeptide repeat protein [Oribacterium sp. FC2011]